MVVVLAPAELRRRSLPADPNLFIVLVELAFDMLKGFVPIPVKMRHNPVGSMTSTKASFSG